MKYSDIDLNAGFTRNMRQTPWTKLFPHWWSEDDLTRSIGDEVERVKAQMIFSLLNMGIKPPVMIWQRSLDNKEYVENHNITNFPEVIEIDAPKYKTWGTITIVNHGEDDIYDLNIMFDETNGITITDTIAPNDKVILDLEAQKFSLNNYNIVPSQHGQGIPYFITSKYGDETDEENKLLSNEILRIKINADNDFDVDLDVNIVLKNAVFTNEQNIEVTSIELLPIDKIDLYVKYDFPFRPKQSGWKLAYTKEYESNTNVVYDMITTQLDTKEFYVEVFFRELEYPYKVGFPCYKDADEDSMYHVNNRLDAWGKILGLPRREYKTEIDEMDYPFTFPVYYPFDIEQDFWYYSRLINEYCWNEEAINEVDLLDTKGYGIMRLHSINPFVEDFAVHAKTIQPTERENINYNFYVPHDVTQISQDINIDDYDTDDTPFPDIHPHRVLDHYQCKFTDIENLLDYNDNYSMITLYNKIGKYITYNLYKSQELDLFFDLSNLPEHINIKGFEFTIDAESTDNLLDKYNDMRTRVELRSFGETIFAKSIGESGQYGLRRDDIVYGGKNVLFDFDEKIINKKIGDVHVLQEFIIKPFSGTLKEYVEIPFTLIENDEEIDELKNVSIIYDNNQTVTADYVTETRSYPDPETNETIVEDVKLLRAYIPEDIEGNTITVRSLKSDTHYPFNITFDISKGTENNTDSSHNPIPYIEGPIVDNEVSTYTISDNWDTGDLRDILQKSGLHFIYTLQNDNETNTPTFIIHNITLKVFYSPKKTQFDLRTCINKTLNDDNAIGTLTVYIKNTGAIPLVSKIDIFNERNISLSTNSINVDLNPQEHQKNDIAIYQEPPLINGVYDIITFCEDEKRQNTITIDTKGLIQTSTKVKPIFTQYHDETNFEAFVNATNKTSVNEGLVEFYINKSLIGTAPVQNGQAILTKTLSDSDIATGFYNFEAKYIGSDKYAPSRTSSIILISKQQTEIEIISEKHGNLNAPYECAAIVKSNDMPVTEGTVTFYLDDEELGRPDVDENGIASLTHIFNDKKPCSYVLKAVYNGTVIYGHKEATKDIILSGGETEVIVNNITAAPTETITLSAQVIQKMCAQSKYTNVNIGQILIKIVDNNNTIYSKTLNVNNEGRVFAKWTIPQDITVKDYDIKCYYTDSSNVFLASNSTGTLSVQRKNVQLKHQKLFYGSRYEPLGFYIQIYDENNLAVTEGEISVKIPSLNITEKVLVDSDSSAKIIHNAIDFTHAEWNELDHLTFKRGEGKVFYYDGVREVEVPENLYRIYDNDYRDLQYVDFRIEDGNLYYKRESQSDEQVYIGDDGYLYARTNIDDIDMDLKQYVIGTHDVIIEYIPSKKYNAATSNSKIKITTPQVDADLHSYNLKYNNQDLITCFITEYDWTKNKNNPVHDKGIVYFYIDNVFLDKTRVQQGRAILPNETLNNITANKHLLSAEYIPDNKKAHTFTYTSLKLEHIPSSINYQKNRILKDKDTHFKFTITLPSEYQYMQDQGYIHGNVDIFLNDEKIDNCYLFGNEKGIFEYTLTIPNDIDEKEYELSLFYEGTKFIKDSTLTIPLQHQSLPVTIEPISIQIAPNEICNVNIPVNASDKDDISEGYIVLYDDNTIISKSNVIHNKASLSFNVGNKNVGNYQYIIKYEDGINYHNGDNNALLKINIINPLNKIYIAKEGRDDTGDGTYTYPFKTIERALSCLADNGEIYIINEVHLTESITIDKNVHINGNNGSIITKDFIDLFQNNESMYNDLHIYSATKLNESLYKINNLKINNLNSQEFSIINKELYFLQEEKLIPIYLYDNGYFYSTSPLSIEDINHNCTITSNKNLKISNVILQSNDNDDINDFIIINNGDLEIYHSTVQPNIAINNYNNITMNRNIIYGKIHAGANYDLDNNWWGTNDVPHRTNNNIILNIKANIEPPVLGEDFHVIVEMIGENGRYYDIPQLHTLLIADTGYFQTPSGVFTNQQFSTLYVDAVKEGKIYATVDNETVELNVYSYDRKTEVILDNAQKIPIGYQIPIKAKVQSCADVFYQFDNKNNIIKQSNNINNGKVIFYLDDIQIGQAHVNNGIAEISVFFSVNKYQTNHTYNLSAQYISDKYYFNSNSSKNIQLITEENICFISPDGDNDNDGTFLKPLQTISAGLLSDKNTIYLKDGYYTDTEVAINHTVNIKKYNNYAIFKDNTNEDTTIFNISNSNDIYVTIEGLDFIDNECSTIINNKGHLNINECLFYNNQVKDTLINNNQSKTLNIYYNAIVNNNKVISNNSKINNLKYCWFGTNTPNEDNCIPNYNICDYIFMDTAKSKNIIYIGTIARITARLTHYKHDKNDEDIYMLDSELPLRLSIFESDSGSLMPLKDYTYNNQSTSLFNSNEEHNSDRIFLSLWDNTNYLNEKLTLKCNVTNAVGTNTNEGDLTFTITDNKKVHIFTVPVRNGIAVLEKSYPKLNIGTYPVQCNYHCNDVLCSTSGQFKVQKPNIIINDCQLHNTTLKSTHIYIEDIYDSLGKTVYNQDVQIFLDGKNIYNQHNQNLFSIENGTLSTIINYPMIKQGKHTLTITTEDLRSAYELLTYEKEFSVNKYSTHINFPYSKIQEDHKFDLVFNILDSNNDMVLDGYVDVYLNNENIKENYHVTNGTCVIPDFIITEQGQYSFYINYRGDDNYYYDTSYVNNNVNVGLYEVIIDSEELQNQLIIDSRSQLDLKFQIKNVINEIVDIGYVNIYIDEVQINDNPLTFKDKYIDVSLPLPFNITVGRHDFTIEYIDESDIYADTTLNTYLHITQIPVNILIDNITTTSSTEITVPYNIQSPYGDVNTGTLSAYVKDTRIGIVAVNNIVNKNITLNIPKLPINTYDIKFIYTDTTANYKETYETKLLNITPKPINITTSPQWYYPNKDFNFIVDLKDEDGQYVDSGEVSIYIDNVKETETQPVVYGECKFILNFNKVQDYNLTVQYTDDKYYASRPYEQTFKVSALPITQIRFEKPLTSVSNTTYNNTIIFDTYEDQDVYDGIVDIFLDGEKKGTYYINNLNKEFSIEIDNIDAGEYDFEIQYHDSELFGDYYPDAFKFTITERTLDMTINNGMDIVAKLNEEINIPVALSTPTKGLIKYYLGVNQESMKFIGVVDIDGSTTNFTYTLPKTLDEKPSNQRYYLIKAVFEGNGQYKESIKYANLDIILTTPSINISPITAYYHSNIDIEVTNNIAGNALLEFYLNDEYIGAEVSKDGECIFNYTLPTQYIADTYDLMVKYNKSSIMNEQTKHTTLTINPSRVVIQTDTIKSYINHDIYINAIGVDTEERTVPTGTMSFSINNNDIEYQNRTSFNIGEQIKYKLPINIVNDTDIKVTYHTDNNKKYQDTISHIDLSMIKHDIDINIDAMSKYARGDTIATNITLSSNTIDDINVPLKVQISSPAYTMPIKNISYENASAPLEQVLDKRLGDYQTYDLKISTDGTDIFNPVEKHFTLSIYNKSKIYVDANINNDTATGSQEDPVRTLSEAIDLVSNSGDIIILSNHLVDITVNVNKDINIINEDNVTCNNTIFNVDKKISLSNFTFESYSNNIFNNNGKLIIKDSIFKDNNARCIINNNVLEIDNTKFNNNTSQESGTCIFIDRNNQHTTITKCSFNENYAKEKGSCIDSNRGNDVHIQGNYFGINNTTDGDGAYISTYGDMTIIDNIFYQCNKSAIYILGGEIQIELNIFHNNIDKVINNSRGIVTANMNYWGTNKVSNIQNKYIGDINLDTYLLANYELESLKVQTSNYIIGRINQYVNKQEAETYEFIFDNFIHNDVDVILYKNDNEIDHKYVNDKMNFTSNDNDKIVIDIFGNKIGVE